ncbi:hypothetical protein [uncultured Sanguibacteroides sp.]|uniref:hypothetical protein n=1 Tax=uncultured Sanguibacteroides sp. TaxID=1635151 RepID=UPI0025EDD0F8|nr:hypothetical protein [uncultured Sanguibacteroides sp.]
MKTVTFIISALLMCFSFSIEAQNHHEEHQGQQHHQRGPRERMNLEQMIQKRVAQLKTELKLDEKQEKQVSELFTTDFKKRGEIFQKYRNNQDSLMFYNQKLEKEQNASMKKILTEEQYKTYITNLEKKKQEMEKRRKEMMDRRNNNREGAPEVREEQSQCCGKCN